MALSSQETIDIYLVAVLVFTMASMSAISNETLLGSTTRFPQNLQSFRCMAHTQIPRMPGTAPKLASERFDRQHVHSAAPSVSCTAISGQTSTLDADAAVVHAHPEVKAILFDMVRRAITCTGHHNGITLRSPAVLRQVITSEHVWCRMACFVTARSCLRGARCW